MMSLLGLLRELVRCNSGTAALEGAIIVPVAISLMAGGVEFGQLFSTYGTAAKSMRDATRYLARVPQAHICDNWALNNALNLAVYGTLTNTDQPLIPNWTPTNISTSNARIQSSLTLVSPSCPPDNSSFITIELRAAVPYTGFMFGAIGLSNTWTLNVKHQERSIGE
jgi:Flp pilus assembly protein TadG